MMQAWKLKREVSRIMQQLKGIPELFLDSYRQKKLDREVANGLPYFQGHLPALDKIALYLIYQPNGVSGSVIETCRWLVDQGFSPLIVSNAELNSGDRHELEKVTWRTIVRPNFGYDFGGYRDGLTFLRRWQIEPETLLILNDSIWIPILTHNAILEDMLEHPADIVGTVLRQRGEIKFLESYLFCIKGHVLKLAEFQKFWVKLKLTSNKYYVIRRGERDFSHAMKLAGIKVEALFKFEDALTRLERCSDQFLYKTLSYASYVDIELAQQGHELLDMKTVEWRKKVLQHIERTLQKRQFYSSFPYAAINLYQYPIMKKSREPISINWRIAYLRAVKNGDLPAPSKILRSEICEKHIKPLKLKIKL